ncbi:hypothetical protein D3C86_2107360 [compost metagenome]
MRWDVLEFGKFAILLKKHSKVLANRVDWPATVCRLAAITDKRVISEVALLVWPLVEEIEHIIQPGDFLHEIPTLRIERFIEQSE